ncbi:mitochondrial integral membrane protein-like protein [Patellaria atrata CBS 101060]|uniref:Mitochondrial integral membrane protein-like protein n=1 Tax=Patellaria atrata CBS 101060 TaxID=1346257 RepID=A0A9P4S6S3_9PEZI|nr:mitochondrial integral membrane protein-like protein [Patellaria atrata CBS 101060]
MVSLWGTNKDDDHNAQGSNSSRDAGNDAQPQSRRSHDEPNERTRLIQQRHPPPNSDGYLDPDDPAVSPYNLWTVRFLRYLTVLFLVVSFLWWVLLLVSIFVSPPGLHSRGSGFFDFSYTTLTVGNLLVALIFFAAPSKAMRISLAIISAFLLIDMIIILTVGRIRIEEGWVGIASVIWASVMAIWCTLVDRVVAWGKREEEERLTGRPETRRTLKEWSAVLIATIILIIYIIITILMTSTLIIRARDASLKAPGERYYVDGEKYQVHLNCLGNVTYTGKKRDPTVILEAGEEPSEFDFEHWAYSAYQNGTISRYCYWDRPGYAWSDNAPSPHSAGMSADALSEALAQAGEEGPWILVSAGTGSLVSRIFSVRHGADIEGILMIDPFHEDLLHRIGSPGRGFVLWGWGVLSPLGIERLGGALFKGRTREDRVYGRNAYQSGKFIKAQLQENLIADSLTKNEVVSSNTIQDKKVPLAIVSSGVKCRTDREWERKQRDLTHLTNELVGWDVVQKAPHQVWKTYEGRKTMERRLDDLVKFNQ